MQCLQQLVDQPDLLIDTILQIKLLYASIPLS